MSGNVKQFVDYSVNTNNDTGLNDAASIRPITNGENVDQTVLQRPSESLRQRSEAIRDVLRDTLYLRDADRSLIIAGPGRVTWSGTASGSGDGIPVISDNLYLIPMLTPGAAQVAPIPPVQSTYGTLHLKRASDNMDSILVTSQRRSYAGGDQISIVVTSGSVFSCTLKTEDAGTYQRTIEIVATAATTLSDVITALTSLTPPSPDNTQLVAAALEGGALGTDLILRPQAKQFVSGNYDGEGHTITPANLAAFFASNPSQVLEEGDTLCVQFSMVTDTASTGGRRQAIPENSNTAIPAASFFNSRVHPEKLVNALPICKVVNGALVFGTGIEIPVGAAAAPLSPREAANITYAGGPAWADGTTNPATTIESQLDKIVSDLAASTGGAKIGGAAAGTDISAANLNTQIADLAVNWGKLARANTWGGAQTYNALVTANAGINANTVAVTGAATVGSTLGVTGDVTASDYKHTVERTRFVSPALYMTDSDGSSHITYESNSGDRWQFGNGNTEILIVPISVDVGDRITGFTAHFFKGSDNTCTLSATLVRRNHITGARTVINTQSTSANAPGTTFVSATGLTEVALDDCSYQIELYQDDATPSGPNVAMGCKFTYDRP